MTDDARPMVDEVAGEPGGWDKVASRRSARIAFSDGSWRTAGVLRWRHRDDQWFLLLSWPGGRTGWHIYDARYVRPE